MVAALKAVVKENTAGSPTRPGLLWTHLPITQISAKLLEKGFRVSRKVIRRLLESLGFKKRRLVKSMTKSPSRNRDEQFRKIHRLRKEFASRNQPQLSIDSKRKEELGPLQRAGTVIANQQADVLDHTLPGYAHGEVTPHGIYDPRRHAAHLNLNTGSDTGEFACASLRWYWEHIGCTHDPQADSLLLLCDCGGSNSFRSDQFKYHLWRWAQAANLTIRVAHYPVYCSKYNPIERRFFPYVEQAWSGRTFATVDELAKATEDVTTRTGLTSSVHVIKEHYEPVRRSKTKHNESPCVIHDEDLPEYNYRILPKKAGQL